ncbi:MAG: hypothetical protein IKJ29_02375 [Akkermansia sp.]|nr:hypothetical protein [Akkermansia sp.]
MKLRLPIQLLSALVLMHGLGSVHAAVRHTDVSTFTYVDFATNSGRYATGTTNELLDYIRQRDGGVKIEYTSGREAYTLPHEMISFDSVSDMGNTTAIGYNYIVTVAHNDSQLYPTFTGNDYGIGIDKAIKYVTVDEYSDSADKPFVHHIYSGANDYKVARLTKLVTDVTPAQMTGGSSASFKGELVYRVGGGLQQLRDPNGNSDESGQGVYLVGGVAGVTDWSPSTSDLRHGTVVGTTSWETGEGAGEGTPLPFGSTEGDSGSTYFVWEGDAETGSYKFLMAHRGSTNNNKQTQGCEALEWTQNVMQEDSFCVDMSKVNGALIINGADLSEDDDKGGVSDTINGVPFTSQVAQGFLADKGGNLYDKNWNAYFRAVETGQNTWKSLSDLKDSDTWYAYGNDFLNATASVVVVDKNVVAATGLTYSKLFQTQNLVFESAADNAVYSINVTRDTDLGVGYVRFAAEKCSGVVFNVESAENKLLNSAGYVVDAGVQVNVSLRNVDSGYMREWRKVGEGTLNICGSGGNNEIFLNVGGKGKTLLNQKGGYAAYNVLVNTGSTVVIADTGQIKRDLTFGNGGGTLDMNGNKMDWYLSEGQKRDGFTIHALTEEAVISNSSSERAELSFMEGGNQSFVGSFCDSKDSALGITYAGGGIWELNGIRTSLENADSGLTVENGTVKLAGSLTVHGYGTTHTRETADFTTCDKDWHYADAKMNVTVKNGAAFELESHARLTGTVTVESGGKYIMHEGVQDDYEYIEGGEKLESTAAIKDYYGHKGGVRLAKDATLSWQRGSEEVASLKGTDASGQLAGIESTISSATKLKLAAAGDENGQISAGVLTLQGGVELELERIDLDASASITSTTAAGVSMNGVTLRLDADNVATSSTVQDASMLVNSFGSAAQATLEAGWAVLDVQASALSGSLTIGGSSLMIDFSAFDIEKVDAIRLSFEGEVEFSAQEMMSLMAQTQKGDYVGMYAGDDKASAYFILVPEPATATLSLMALAALVARRRRS